MTDQEEFNEDFKQIDDENRLQLLLILRGKMTDKITWTGSPDDQTAKIGDYVLRVEQMDDYYWWCMYFGDDYYEMDWTQTKEQAKTAAINAMKEHKDGKH